MYAAHQYDGALARLGAPQNPDEAWFQCRVDSLLMLGRTADALAHWREVLRLDPDNLTVLAQCAWALSTDPDPALRNGNLAVEYAEHASRLREGRAPVVLDALAAAYAETGRFPEAVQAARGALDLALEQNNATMADALRSKIAQYEAGRPMRAAPPSAGRLSAP